MAIFLNSSMLSNGIKDANDHLREMCGGEQLVQIDNRFDWIFDPQESELTYTAKEGAPEEAVKRAARLCEIWNNTYLRITAESYPAPLDGWPTFSLWWVVA